MRRRLHHVHPGARPVRAHPRPVSGAQGQRRRAAASAGPLGNPLGAFASSRENLIGMAGGRRSEREATQAAIAHCVSKGGTDCKTAMTFYNQCAIVAAGAVGNGQYTTIFRKHYTIEQATDDAMQICKEKNLTECKVHFSDCSQAEFIQ